MRGIDRFELAIVEFGVKSALEYFATPEDKLHIFNELIEMEMKYKNENISLYNIDGFEIKK